MQNEQFVVRFKWKSMSIACYWTICYWVLSEYKPLYNYMALH